MEQNIIKRDEYLNQLIKWKDHKIIKVITGIRRCGKSTLLCSIFRNYLLEQGVTPEQIIVINLELLENEHLCDYRSLYNHVMTNVVPDKRNYVMIDEVQNANQFQKAIDSLSLFESIDLYITGSNAYLLSGELATLLSGRYVTIEMLPLSLIEFVGTRTKSTNIESLYRDYARWGGFPFVRQLNGDSELINQYLDGLYNTIIKKDIITRNKISDIFVLEDVIRFVFDNIGNILSSKKISDSLTSHGRKVSRPTIDAYLGYLINSYAINKVGRYDIKGKEHLKSLEKYYVTDLGLRNYLLGFRDIDRGYILENIIYLELKRRGFDVFIGKYEDKEIDFIANNNDGVVYIQVAETIKTKVVLERELAPLKAIKNFHRRVVITLDYEINQSFEGIRIINALEWLTRKIDF